MVELTLEVGKRLDLDADRRRNLEFGALLHDVGKIAIPKEIINKPGRLEPGEWAIVKTHTVEGQRILSASAASWAGGAHRSLSSRALGWHRVSRWARR